MANNERQSLLAAAKAKRRDSSSIDPSTNWCVVGTVLIMMVISWVLQNEVAQYLEANHGQKYSQPYFLVWLNHVCLLFVFIPAAIFFSDKSLATFYEYTGDHICIQFGSNGSFVINFVCLSFLYQIANYIWYIGAPMTSIGIANGIFNSQFVITFLFSYLLLDERVTYIKMLSLIICASGILFLFKSQLSETEHADGIVEISPAGNILVGLSAVILALYQVLYKKHLIYTSSLREVSFNLGMIGCFTLIFLWPGIFIGNAFGNPFYLPETASVWKHIAANACLATLFNVLFMVGLTLGSPVLVSVSWLMCVPLSFVADWEIHGIMPTWIGLVGGALVVVGVLLLHAGYRDEKKRYPMDDTIGITL